VDKYGFDENRPPAVADDYFKFQGGPVGIGTISAAINEEVETIEDVYEPYLIQIGFLERTPRGRVRPVWLTITSTRRRTPCR